MSESIARVWRFREGIGVSAGGGAVYFTPQQATQFAVALMAAAEDIGRNPEFSKSQFGTHEIV